MNEKETLLTLVEDVSQMKMPLKDQYLLYSALLLCTGIIGEDAAEQQLRILRDRQWKSLVQNDRVYIRDKLLELIDKVGM